MTESPLLHLALSGAHLERRADLRADTGLLPRLLSSPSTRIVEVVADRVLVRATHPDAAGLALAVRAPDLPADLELTAPAPFDSGAQNPARSRVAVYLGEVDEVPHVAVISPPATAGASPAQPRTGGSDAGDAQDRTDGTHGLELLGLRECGTRLAEPDRNIAATAIALSNWHATHPRCPRCGRVTIPAHSGWVRHCPTDASDHFPRTDPAVIMSVVDDDERLLLARNPRWPAQQFSVLAGFVEPGESFEAAVAREVGEEVGVPVRDVRYLGSQPWPFPASIMVGFTARAVDTSLTLDPVEIAEARWVSREEYRDELRSGALRVPSGISIARRLVERWLGQGIDSLGVGPR